MTSGMHAQARASAGPERRDPSILALIKGLGAGGAERLLVSIAAHGRARYDVAYLLGAKDALVSELERAGARAFCLHGERIWDPRWLGRLRSLIVEGGYDVVHIHSPLVAAFARPAIRALPAAVRPVLVSTEHVPWSGYHPATRWLNRLTFGMDAAHIAVSDSVLASVDARVRGRVQPIVHGIPIEEVRSHAGERALAREELGIGPDEVLVGTVGNYRAQKDYPTLLRAARTVLEREPSVRFVGIGQGALEDEITALHRDMGLGDGFRLLGHREDVYRILSAFDIFTLASRFEGYPIAAMEALAMGLPIAGTDVPGLRDAIEHGTDGLLGPAGAADVLADNISTLVRDPALRARMSAAARARAERFDIARAAEQIEAVYHAALADGGGRR